MAEPGEHHHGVNKEGKEIAQTSTINIYATESTRTHMSHVTKQGFGVSTPLDKPQTEIYYHWNGKLHPTELQRRHPQSRDTYVSSSNAHADLEALAQNFAHNYRETSNPDLQREGKPSYALSFEPSKALKKAMEEQGIKYRHLTQEEQDKFMEAFLEANKRATDERTQGTSKAKHAVRSMTPPPTQEASDQRTASGRIKTIAAELARKITGKKP